MKPEPPSTPDPLRSTEGKTTKPRPKLRGCVLFLIPPVVLLFVAAFFSPRPIERHDQTKEEPAVDAWASAKPAKLSVARWAERRGQCESLKIEAKECSQLSHKTIKRKLAVLAAADKKAAADAKAAQAARDRKAADEMCAEDVTYAAANAVKDAVRSGLKAPSTASFPDDPALSHEGCLWAASGHVDAQNSFGAMLRSTYRVQVFRVTSSIWAPIRVAIR